MLCRSDARPFLGATATVLSPRKRRRGSVDQERCHGNGDRGMGTVHACELRQVYVRGLTDARPSYMGYPWDDLACAQSANSELGETQTR